MSQYKINRFHLVPIQSEARDEGVLSVEVQIELPTAHGTDSPPETGLPPTHLRNILVFPGTT